MPYSDERWANIVQCMLNMSTIRVPLRDVDNSSWNAMMQYAFSSVGDPWGQRGSWLEWNPQPMCKPADCTIANASEIIIGEPCDYVSNAAYYISMLSLCATPADSFSDNAMRALVQSFDMLTVGSSFFHGSATNVGALLDVTPIGLIALVSYQSAVGSLPPTTSSVLHDLRNETDNTLDGVVAVAVLGEILNEMNVNNWTAAINELRLTYQSNYYLTFGATVIVIMRMILPDSLVQALIPVLGNLLKVSQEDIDWLAQVYDPILTVAFEEANVRVGLGMKVELLKRGVGVLLKMLYAFLWQEQTIIGPWLYSPPDNFLGALAMPWVNAVCDFLTGYPHPEDVAYCGDVYPGSTKCRDVVAHAKWHEISANGLVDLIYLANNVHQILIGGNIAITQPQAHLELLLPAQAGCFDVFNNADMLKSWICDDKSWKCALKAGFGRKEDAMDNCLMYNECLGENNTVPIFDCVHGACAEHVVDAVALDNCLATCSSLACGVLCARQFSNFSPLGSALLDCLPAGENLETTQTCPFYEARLAFSGFDSIREFYDYAQCVSQKMGVTPFWKAVGDSAQCAASVLDARQP